MKQAILVAIWLLALSNVAFGQTTCLAPIDAQDDRPWVFECVKEADATSTELLSRAKLWVAVSYQNPDEVTRLVDEAAGRIVVEGTDVLTTCGRPQLRYMLVIEVKDGRYRYTVDDLSIEYGARTFAPHATAEWGNYRKPREEALSEASGLIFSLNRAMQHEEPEW